MLINWLNKKYYLFNRSDFMKICLIICYVLFMHLAPLYAQKDSALITELVNDIAAAQVKQPGAYFQGMFPAYRACEGYPHNYQPDNNIFFTAITAFTLKHLSRYLNPQDAAKALQIIKNAVPAYRYYRNPNGKPFYSFWPAGARILPHSYFINQYNGILAQGDDADDSVMILLASDNNDSDNTALKERLVQVSNLKKRKINATFKKYRNIPAYSTYLGEKMHPDFDFAVQCNILYFNLEKKLPPVQQDSATIFLLAEIVKNREYMKRPVYISPCYAKPAVQLYHITRLIHAFKIDQLELYKKQLISDAYRLLAKATNIMDRIILRTALIRLGAEVPGLTINTISDFEKTDQEDFVFFQARAAFAQPTPLKQIFLHWNYLIYSFYCAAYNKVLWLEYLVLKNQQHGQAKR
jgi:hypothetical protein